MDPRRILLIQGHPDPTGHRLGHMLAAAYAEGATSAGHELRVVDVAQLDFPLLRTQADWESGPVPPALRPAQQDLLWCQHLVIFFPLWMGDMPALLKGFIEQVGRPNLNPEALPGGAMPPKALKGRSARVVVTMGMPAAVYRWYFRAHAVKSLERNILGILGVAPVHETLIGLVDRLDDKGRARWMTKLRLLGREAA
jgi:putative NADPH-quinone reductase